MNIIIENMTKTYRGKVQALQGVNLEIPHGMYGLLGPNGAGKTTFMRILAGILRPSSGSMRIGEIDVTTEEGRTQVKQILGYLPQDLGMYPDLSAREFLDYIGILKGLQDRKARKQRVEELLEMVALTSVAQRKLKTFSGGMKRRVGIAQALLNDPQLLIVDEPTAGLDPEERIRFRNLLSNLGDRRTVLLSTHIVEDIAQTCQHLAILRQGQVTFQGTIAQMLQQARGSVWLVTTPPGFRFQGAAEVVSTINMGSAMQYRIVGDRPPQTRDVSVVAVEPGLEDSYLWLMRGQQETGLKTLPH
ncbi:ABC transporter ATP-binding protein [Dictyobacter kobayashii]|uniref:Multidrug ABC transporter ATP-binding protein n=1 Tax=Dictyobacter kobayashii TaxID=2014872 RepID=A0A402ATK7_9CHLR|nr:ABC transporter ATP-binding protein [Dictyobacter kobayashii]GCE22405.1 multidrug ABC transporter ATP-binding protein [Dictyobacter kobayashii]